MAQFNLGTPIPCNAAGVPLGAPGPPMASSILNGYQTTNASTIITIPANSMALVNITISGAESSASITGRPTVTVQGTGSPTPASGAVVAALAISTNAGISNAASAATFNGIYVYSGTAAATLQLNLGGISTAAAVVNGAVL
jgi:hypothetical protein